MRPGGAPTSLLEPIVHGGFDRISVTPYDVTSTVFSLDRLAAATGEERWTELAQDARAWFEGRNTAGAPVYDRARGRVADGIDEGRISENSGAEANIEAGGALLDAAGESASLLAGLLPPPDPTSPRPHGKRWVKPVMRCAVSSGMSSCGQWPTPSSSTQSA